MSYYARSVSNQWEIVFKTYDSNGLLLSLTDTTAVRIKSKWRLICSFLNAPHSHSVREVCFRKHGRFYPSLVNFNGSIRFHEPLKTDVWGVL